MASKTGLLNMALGHLAVGKTVGNFDTEQTAAARIGRTFYDIALGVTLEAAHWPFATRVEALGLVAETLEEEWSYSYRYPSNCIKFERILSGGRTDSRESQVKYRIIGDDDGQLIRTDMASAEAEYLIGDPDPSTYSWSFKMAFTYLLAHLMAPSLTSGDQAGLGAKAGALYTHWLGKASAHDLNQEVLDEPQDAESIRVREV